MTTKRNRHRKRLGNLESLETRRLMDGTRCLAMSVEISTSLLTVRSSPALPSDKTWSNFAARIPAKSCTVSLWVSVRNWPSGDECAVLLGHNERLQRTDVPRLDLFARNPSIAFIARAQTKPQLGNDLSWGFGRSLSTIVESVSVGWSYVFGPRSLRARPFFVSYSLTDLKMLELDLFDGRVVKENITPLSSNESKTLVRNNLLYGPMRHLATLQKKLCVALTARKTKSSPSSTANRGADTTNVNRRMSSGIGRLHLEITPH